mgnify:CR=1 FL=1
MKKIIDLLFENSDLNYKTFTSNLIPNINIDSIIGVRIPVLRKFAKEVFNAIQSAKKKGSPEINSEPPIVCLSIVRLYRILL